jgi:Outer membrane protein beta-barrel domain
LQVTAIAATNFEPGVSIMSCVKPFITASVLLLVTLLASISATAQSDDSRFEAGIQVSLMGRGSGIFFDGASIGGGGRLTFNLNRYLALEGEMNYFPENGFGNLRRLQGQFGVKSGIRFKRFGLFGKIRPGFQDREYEVPIYCSQYIAICPLSPYRVGETGFSMDLGGVFEFYPAKRITLRIDAGDTILTHNDQPIYIGPPRIYIFPAQSRHTSNTFQLSTGIGFRF